MLTAAATHSSILAFVTTIHLALAALRNHRTPSPLPIGSLAFVSLGLAATPWVFPTPVGLLAGLACHAVWFAVCERFITPVSKAQQSRPAAPSASGVARGEATSTPAGSRHAAATSGGRVDRPKGFVPVPVLAIHDETPTVKTFRLARPEGFDFDAGQFLTVRVRVDGKEYARCYSISSAPDVRGYLEISVKRQGLVSNALHASIRPGALLSVRPPAGAFKFPAADDRPLLLLAAGIGITPLMSMLRHAIATEPARPITLLYGARSESELAFRDELAVATRRHPQMRAYFAVSEAGTAPDIYPGRIDEALLRATMPDIQHVVSLICGPRQMIDDMRRLLASLGVPEPQIRFEVFQAAVAAAAGLDAHTSSPAEPERATVRHMECIRVRKRVPVRAGQSLLEAAETAGVEIASLCRSGVCGTCRVRVSSGEVACESTVLDADDRAQGYVLACVTTAQTDCVADL